LGARSKCRAANHQNEQQQPADRSALLAGKVAHGSSPIPSCQSHREFNANRCRRR
jgi:hypothetical protein